jgi:hypothetical protein
MKKEQFERLFAKYQRVDEVGLLSDPEPRRAPSGGPLADFA